MLDVKGRAAMRVKRSLRRLGNHVSVNKQFQAEIEVFLYALDSYEEKFATNPRITFDEHCASLMAYAQVARSAGFSPREN